MVRFTPTATVNNAKPNDIVRFHLQGRGFFDPYSSYLRIEVHNDMSTMHFPKDATGAYTTQPRNDMLLHKNLFCGKLLDRSAHSLINRLTITSSGTELERIEQYDILAAMLNDVVYSNDESIIHHYEGFPFKSLDVSALCAASPEQNSYLPFFMQNNYIGNAKMLCDQGFWKFETDAEHHFEQHYDNSVHVNALRIPIRSSADGTFENTWDGDKGAVRAYTSPSVLTFCIPIYSGVIGVLQQDRRMIPLSLIPLQVEFTLNPYAFYSVSPIYESNHRDYTVTKMWMYSHVLTFEQELHRSLESSIAARGLLIHFNTFYLAPVTTHQGDQVLNYAQINIHSKSINSLHTVFLYSGFEQKNGTRKLHFVNHNLTQLQVRNGIELTPSEPIQSSGVKETNDHTQFFVEMLKSYNRMHDPSTDMAFSCANYTTDAFNLVPYSFLDALRSQASLGRCQYGISLEGEELGTEKSLITGKKGMQPFDINMTSAGKMYNVNSFQFIFARQDLILFVRPDLVVELTGK